MRDKVFGLVLSLTCFATILCFGPSAHAVNATIDYSQDAAGEGFNDPALGASRKAAFEYAVALWADQLGGNVTIVIQARFDDLGGTGGTATLAFAGSSWLWRDVPGLPLSATFYDDALANQLTDGDIDPDPDINVTVNSDIDGPVVLGSTVWYYGTDGNPPAGTLDLVTTVLHELGHGLGFSHNIIDATGAYFGGFPSIYDRQLVEGFTGSTGLAAMSDGARSSAITGGDIWWSGPQVVAHQGGMVEIYAPAAWADGSSISHWDDSNTPNLLMEPFDTGAMTNIGLTREALLDMGWTFPVPEIAVDTTPLFFPGQDPVAGPSAPQTVRITNDGAANLTYSAAVSGGDAAQFSVPAASGSVAPGQTLFLAVLFDPDPPTGARNTVLTITSNDVDEASIDLAVSGLAADLPEIDPVPAAADLPDQDRDAGPSAPFTVAVWNNGSLPLTFGTPSAELVGGDIGEFTILSKPPDGGTLSPNQSAGIELIFDPSSYGTKTTDLLIYSDDIDEGALIVPVTGDSPAPVPSGVESWMLFE